jgi:hypothetical protein
MGNAWCDVHRVAEHKSLLNAASPNEFFNSGGDVHKAAAAFDFEPEVFG